MTAARSAGHAAFFLLSFFSFLFLVLLSSSSTRWLCNYEDSEVSLKCGKLRQIKAKTENPTYTALLPLVPLFQNIFLTKTAPPRF